MMIMMMTTTTIMMMIVCTKTSFCFYYSYFVRRWFGIIIETEADDIIVKTTLSLGRQGKDSGDSI